MIYINEKKLTAYIIDENSKKIIKEVELIPKELACLLCLIKGEGLCATREFLLDSLWDSIVSDASLNNLVKNIRAKIFTLTNDSDVIITVPKKGYRIDINKIAFHYDTALVQPDKTASNYLIINDHAIKKVTVCIIFLSSIFILFGLSSGRNFDSVQNSNVRESVGVLAEGEFLTIDFYLKSWRYRLFVYDHQKRLLVRESGMRFSIFDFHFLLRTSIMYDVDYPNAALLANVEKRYNPSLLRQYNISIAGGRCELNVDGYKTLLTRYDIKNNSCIAVN